MKKKTLGRDGIDVSELSFGTVSIGRPYGIGISGKQDMPPESEAIDLLRTAFDHGVNFYDTAHFYGQSETLLGKAFKGKRDQVVICSKSDHYHRKEEALPSGQEIRKITEQSLQKSLPELQTDYLDVYMLHNGDVQTQRHEDVIDLFTQYKKKG
jgi:aryl-alcohol dehydrogenase-like predicted oxidoreductase